MADKTGIEWTDASWNPVVGCSIVSPGCTNCYAMGQAARIIRCAEGLSRETHYAGTIREVKGKPVWTGKLALAPDRTLLQPLRWKRGRKIFVNSMGDLFHEDVPDEWIDRVFAVMALAPQHTFQVLTKRAARMRVYLAENDMRARIAPIGAAIMERSDDAYSWLLSQDWPLPNVWLGVSAEDQTRAEERVPDLLATPAAIRFVSAEPLVGPIDFMKSWEMRDGVLLPAFPALDWIIVGGESGPGARPMHPDWERQIREDCAAAGVAYFRKQWGSWKACASNDGEWPVDAPGFIRLRADGTRGPDGWPMQLVGKKAAGRLLDGVEHSAMPEVRHG